MHSVLSALSTLRQGIGTHAMENEELQQTSNNSTNSYILKLLWTSALTVLLSGDFMINEENRNNISSIEISHSSMSQTEIKILEKKNLIKKWSI